MRDNQKGFGLVVWVIMIVVVVAVALGCYRVAQNATAKQAATASPKPSVTSQPTKTKRIVAVGDIVCDPLDPHLLLHSSGYCQDEAVATLAKSLDPDAILGLGDLQYDNGSIDKFKTSYSKNWSQFKTIMYPAPGNHEYGTAQAKGYYTYFQDAPVDVSKGYYSFQLGDWNIISLNSNCDKISGCGPETAQSKWLGQELDSNKAQCTLAYWHHPRFTSGKYINDDDSKSRSVTFWEQLTGKKADVVLNGHDHLYERFAPQTSGGQQDEFGMREFIVGTGGKEHYKQQGTTKNSQKAIDDQYGVLVMDLYPKGYRWQFVNITNQVLDSGYQRCN